jgi:UDP-hydrolysing UDP-N-acetyl-D-glucosamine 2-epimerase
VAKKLGLDRKKHWFLVAMHPTPFESVSTKGQIDPLVDLLKTLNGEKIIIYPNSDTGGLYFIKKIDTLKNQKNVHIFANLPMQTYLQLMKNCDVFLGNSSSGLTEAGFLKTPFVNVGNRQKGRESGPNVIFSDYTKAGIQKALKVALSDTFRKKLKKSTPSYTGGNVAHRVVSILESRI